jgi:hypothetical protein
LGSGVDESTNEVSHSESEALISELRSHNDTLREQLASERAQLASEREANRHVIDALIRRIAELEAPQNREPSVQSVGTPDSASRDRKPPDQVETNSEGPPRPGGDPVMPRSTILASLVPLPKEYLRNPRDGRVQNTAMAREIAEEEGARSGAGGIQFMESPGVAGSYVLEIILTALATLPEFSDSLVPTVPSLGVVGEYLTLRLVVAVAFGVLVGAKEAHEPSWRRIHIVGVATGALTFLVAVWSVVFGDQYVPALGHYLAAQAPPSPELYDYLPRLLVKYLLGTWLMFISGALLGKALQYKAEQDRWGTPNVSYALGQRTEASGGWSARATAIVGLIGVLGAALLQSAGQVLSAILGGE